MTDTSFLFSSPITSNEPMQTVLSKRCYLWLWNHSYVSHSEYNFGVQPFSNLSVYWNATLLSVLAAGPGDSSGSQLLSNSLNLLSVASNLKNAQTLLSTLQKNLPPNANLPANIKSLAARVLRAQGEYVSATVGANKKFMFRLRATVILQCDRSSKNGRKFLLRKRNTYRLYGFRTVEVLERL